MGHRLVTLLRSNSVAASTGGAFGGRSSSGHGVLQQWPD
jgi:hypothetical protein